MRAVIGLLGMLIVAGVGLFIYRAEFTGKGAASMGTDNPRGVVDVTGAQADLTAMAQAERGLLAQNGHHATLEELESKYSGPTAGMPALSINETMQIARK